MKRITTYFFEGLLFVIPLAATFYILYKLFVTVDGLLGFPVPGMGFVVTIVGIILIGFLASNVITRSLLSLVDRLFSQVPLIKLLYSSVKDLIGAFVGDKKSFDKPVLVRLTPSAETRMIGFVTRESLESFGLKDYVAVYLPQSYNFAGNLLLVPREQVEELHAESADVMAFIVSGGVSGK